MKRYFVAIGLCAAVLGTPASAQVSVSIGQPGFYGRIDIGGFPPPVLIYPEPVIIYPGRVTYEPLYLRVPPGHAKNWKHHCKHYRACGRPVYFVHDDWYRHEYAPRYRERHAHRQEHRQERRHDDHGKGHGRGRD